MSILGKTRTLSALVACGLTLGFALTAAAAFYVYSPVSWPGGKKYSTQAADWWKWALAQPADKSPLLDTTGANCAQGQSGITWYLAGTLDGQPVTRSCTIPSGKTILFPVINAMYASFPTDPAIERTEAFVRSQVTFIEEATNLSVQIDGTNVANVRQYLVKSDIFSTTLPPNNIEGLPAGQVFDPAADEGYYLALSALSYGKHTIRFRGQIGTFSQDVTYNITIK